jgi:hypothetical protein
VTNEIYFFEKNLNNIKINFIEDAASIKNLIFKLIG